MLKELMSRSPASSACQFMMSSPRLLEEFLAFGLKTRDRRAAVGGIGAGQTEVQGIAAPPAATADRISGAIFILRNGCGSTTRR